MKRSFGFILNHVAIEANLPAEIIPGHILQRADEEQTVEIKETLARFGSFAFHANIFEQSHTQDPKTNAFNFEVLPRELWRYWVVTFEGRNSELQELDIALSLLRNDLQIGFTILLDKDQSRGMLWNSIVMSQYTTPMMLTRLPPVTNADIMEVGATYTAIKNAEKSFPNIYRVTQAFHQIKNVSPYSGYAVIAYISIIEGLITHPPELTEPMDSLTHQIKTKMSLLSKRFQRTLDCKEFFGTSDTDKIWGKLYQYRSKIAHGDVPNFDKDLSLLGNSIKALEFIKEAAKLVTLYAIKDPEFVTDLKRC